MMLRETSTLKPLVRLQGPKVQRLSSQMLYSAAGPACGSGAMDKKTLVVQEAQIPMYTGDESSWVSVELRSSPGEA